MKIVITSGEEPVNVKELGRYELIAEYVEDGFVLKSVKDPEGKFARVDELFRRIKVLCTSVAEGKIKNNIEE